MKKTIFFVTLIIVVLFTGILFSQREGQTISELVPCRDADTEWYFAVNTWGCQHYVALYDEEKEMARSILDTLDMESMQPILNESESTSGFKNTVLHPENISVALHLIRNNTEYIIHLKEDYTEEILYLRISEGTKGADTYKTTEYQGELKGKPASELLSLKQVALEETESSESMTRRYLSLLHRTIEAALQSGNSAAVNAEDLIMEDRRIYQVQYGESTYYIDCRNLLLFTDSAQTEAYTIPDAYTLALEMIFQ